MELEETLTLYLTKSQRQRAGPNEQVCSPFLINVLVSLPILLFLNRWLPQTVLSLPPVVFFLPDSLVGDYSGTGDWVQISSTQVNPQKSCRHTGDWKGKDRWVPGACCPNSLKETVNSKFSKRPCLKSKVESHRGRCLLRPLAFTSSHTCECTHMWHTYTNGNSSQLALCTGESDMKMWFNYTSVQRKNIK